MTKKEKKIAKSPANINVVSFVRKIEAPLLPAPPSEVGVKGWLYHNIFQSMSDFSSIQSCIKSILIAIFTGFVFIFLPRRYMTLSILRSFLPFGLIRVG